MGKLEGRVAIVTGASSGIGRACAVRFAEEGATVVVCARRTESLKGLVWEIEATGGQALAVTCDVTKPTDISHVVSTAIGTFGAVDILANIAQGGIEDLSDIADTTAERAQYAYDSGPLQSMLFMQECFKYMRTQRYGRIINTASPAAVTGFPGLAAYAMAKGAVMALTRSASQEWGQFGIVTNTFLPWVRTETFDQTELAKSLPTMEASSPLRRMGTAYEDCTPVLAFLASEEARYINGQAIAVDGGRRLIA
ncbi:MAG TPA: SDR family oxidoreductase [Mycobacterium sp.]|nr:SDR family oxidoreductase [Rhodococcus wratislaviensis]HJT96253.1 SDR family oxidoreductase [Mycobacterium sp.]